ncbi:MAG: hypothetical protein U0531_06675 [Dehalococcoidia bacterium]
MAGVSRIDGDRVTLTSLFTGDTVLEGISRGRGGRPHRQRRAYRSLADGGREVHVAGDSLAPRRAIEAMQDGHRIGRRINGGIPWPPISTTSSAWLTPQLIARERWLSKPFACSVCRKSLVLWRHVSPPETDDQVLGRIDALIAARKETVDGRCHHVACSALVERRLPRRRGRQRRGAGRDRAG